MNFRICKSNMYITSSDACLVDGPLIYKKNLTFQIECNLNLKRWWLECIISLQFFWWNIREGFTSFFLFVWWTFCQYNISWFSEVNITLLPTVHPGKKMKNTMFSAQFVFVVCMQNIIVHIIESCHSEI